ncbi:MAG TPA: type IV pilin-like G/H family protein, partial [Cyanophyceae cyanobacterium]
SSVRYGRLASLALVQFIIIGFGLMMLPSFFNPGIPKPTRNQEWQTKQNRDKQWQARRNITSMNQFQQESYRKEHRFVHASPDIDLEIPIEPEIYKYSTHLTDKAVFNYAIAQNNNLKSYVGGVFEVPPTDFYPALQGKTATIGIVCESDFPGITKTLPEPIYDRGELWCGSGTSELPDPLAGGSGE